MWGSGRSPDLRELKSSDFKVTEVEKYCSRGLESGGDLEHIQILENSMAVMMSLS